MEEIIMGKADTPDNPLDLVAASELRSHMRAYLSSSSPDELCNPLLQLCHCKEHDNIMDIDDFEKRFARRQLQVTKKRRKKQPLENGDGLVVNPVVAPRGRAVRPGRALRKITDYREDDSDGVDE